METQAALSFPDVSNFMSQTYMDEQMQEVDQNQQSGNQLGLDVATAIQALDNRVTRIISSFDNILQSLTGKLDSVMRESNQSLTQITSLLEEQRRESRSREDILEEKFLLFDQKETNVEVEDSLFKMSGFLDELSTEIMNIKPSDANPLLDAIKGMPKWVIGTLIAMGVVTAAQLGLPEVDESTLAPGVGNGGDLSAEGDPNAAVINKGSATDYGSYKKVGGTISWRNNNPGNLVYSDFTKERGAIGYIPVGKYKFAVFPTLEAGKKAREDLIFNGMYRNMSLYEFSRKYTDTDQDAYLKALTDGLGLPKETKISDLSEEQRQKMLAIITKTEAFIPGVVVQDKDSNIEGKTSDLGSSDLSGTFKDLAKKYGAQITSLKRSPERNKEVGGAENSYHLTGQAADMVVPKENREALIKEAESMGLEAIRYDSHIHLEPAPNKKNLSQNTEPPIQGKPNTSGENLLNSTENDKKYKNQFAQNMLKISNGGAKQATSGDSSAKNDLVPAINLKNSMVA